MLCLKFLIHVVSWQWFVDYMFCCISLWISGFKCRRTSFFHRVANMSRALWCYCFVVWRAVQSPYYGLLYECSWRGRLERPSDGVRLPSVGEWWGAQWLPGCRGRQSPEREREKRRAVSWCVEGDVSPTEALRVEAAVNVVFAAAVCWPLEDCAD